MPPPDWGRHMIVPPGNFHPVGDPTRWGASVNQNLPLDVTASKLDGYISEQFISVQTRDPYSRSWAIAGTLTALGTLFSLPEFDNTAGTWSATLQITMGVAQVQMVHNINLRAVIAADAPFYRASDAGEAMFGPFALPLPFTVPFVIPGGLIGNSISICVRQDLRLAAPSAFPLAFATSLVVTPFAPGKGM